MPFSYARRRARGDSSFAIFGHVLKRSVILIVLGIFLRSIGHTHTNYTFEDVVTQIGLGYTFIYFLLFRPLRTQAMAAALILTGYWLLFALYPLPPADFDYSVVYNDPLARHFTGFFAHWNKYLNPMARFDQWFLNLFPREKPFTYNRGGYGTLNFIPSMATMLFGMMAGEVLRSKRTPFQKFRWLVLASITTFTLGLLANATICPIVKRIWTPSWALFSAGWAYAFLAGFYGIIDLAGWKKWGFIFVVVGMNPIFAYCSIRMRHWIADTWRTHLGQHIFDGPYGPFWCGTAVVFTVWLVMYWMYRNKVFIRV